ncbi:MAG: DUF6048 family protein [Paraprevotella sp.]|nr:DUF6048 family protein [Paraprevotella sp.]
MYPKILKYISAAIFSLLLPSVFHAQEKTDKPTIEDLTQKKAPLFGGVSLSAALVVVIMKSLHSDYSKMEVAAHLNFKEKYFPVFELGYGESDYEGSETGNTYHTGAPYFRIGMDYNFTKKWYTGNRLYLGVRYAFTSFKYDISSQGFSDPVWNAPVPFAYNNLAANSHWGEVVFGIETKIWGIFHLGWNVRYKLRISQSEKEQGVPWYVPGFGKYGSSCLGGTFNIIFDI